MAGDADVAPGGKSATATDSRPAGILFWSTPESAAAFDVELVDFWLFTGEIKLWHLVRTINAGITVGLFLFADKALRRMKRGRSHSDELVHAIIGVCLYVRAFLGVYLSAKLLHIVVTAVDWSAVHWRIVPW